VSGGRRVLLAAYPPSFRERYGDELDALLEDTGTGPREILDLLAGAARAWLRPAYGADPAQRRRLRLLSSVSTVWVGFCVVLCGTLGTLRLLEDPPVPGLALGTPRWQAFHLGATEALFLSIVLVLVGGVPVGIRALRSGRAARRLVAGPVVALLLLAAFTVLVYTVAVARMSDGGPPYPTWVTALLLAWLVATPLVAVWWAVALPMALRAAGRGVGDLVLPAVLGAAVAALLAVPLLLIAAVAFRTVRFWGVGVESGIVALCVAGVAVAWLVTAVSAARSLPALRPVRQ
jgi:hypothetical protein